MLNQRTLPAHIKVKQLIDSGELGQLRRDCWTITDWFRTQYYYDSGDWRASWRGEGGGVLTNQCPHQLDLFQWFFGLPSKIRATAKLGKYHDIEVEDEVNAYMEYANGMTANFIASTGECPGVNRLEITGERGLLILTNRNEITFRRNEVEMSEFSRTAKKGFSVPGVWDCKIPVGPANGAGHLNIIENVADAVLGKAELIAPLAEGIKGLELGNAMLYSGLNDCEVNMPLDSAAYAEMLGKLVETSRWQKKTSEVKNNDDFSKSY
jgi:predicted dehydrogenase